MEKKTCTIWATVHRERKKLALATVTLERGKVSIVWTRPGTRLQDEIEGGIVTAAGKFKPSDGQKFFDALPLAFSNSSFVYVKDGEPST